MSGRGTSNNNSNTRILRRSARNPSFDSTIKPIGGGTGGSEQLFWSRGRRPASKTNATGNPAPSSTINSSTFRVGDQVEVRHHGVVRLGTLIEKLVPGDTASTGATTTSTTAADSTTGTTPSATTATSVQQQQQRWTVRFGASFSVAGTTTNQSTGQTAVYGEHSFLSSTRAVSGSTNSTTNSSSSDVDSNNNNRQQPRSPRSTDHDDKSRQHQPRPPPTAVAQPTTNKATKKASSAAVKFSSKRRHQQQQQRGGGSVAPDCVKIKLLTGTLFMYNNGTNRRVEFIRRV